MIGQMDRRLVFGIGLTWAENVNNPPPDYEPQMAARLYGFYPLQTQTFNPSQVWTLPEIFGLGLRDLHVC